VVAWFREQAKQFNRMADDTERAFSIPKVTVQYRGASDSATKEPLTKERVESAVRQKGGRVVHLSKRLGVTEEELCGVLAQPDIKVEVGQRGWLRLKE
jgi:hypothetical protein